MNVSALKQYIKAPAITAVTALIGFPIIMFALLKGQLTLAQAITDLMQVATLIVIECVFSIDNTIVTSYILNRMDDTWKRRFLTWGMLFAVGFVRFLFPLLIVAVSLGISPIQNPFHYLPHFFGLDGTIITQSYDNALGMMMADPLGMSKAIAAIKGDIEVFAGVFLLNLFAEFLADEEKDVHWIGIEKFLQFKWLPEIVNLLSVGFVWYFVPQHLFAAAISIALIVSHKLLADFLDKKFEAMRHVTGTVAKLGLTGFIQLEIMDCSFSLDGVVGAFAISDNLLAIAIGLGVGAYVVRNLTLFVCDHGNLDSMEYLEHSAFWSIGILAVTMFVGLFVEVPEWITPIVSVSIIGLGFHQSLNLLREKEADTIIT